MAQDKSDASITKDMFNSEEKQLISDALKTHYEKVGRKAAAPAPKQIKDLWENELDKIEKLARRLV